MKVLALEIQSDSNANKSYRVAVDKNGVISCTCPSWKFQSKPIELRSCKHIAFLKSTLLARAMS